MIADRGNLCTLKAGEGIFLKREKNRESERQVVYREYLKGP
jgi:hypothetical protein